MTLLETRLELQAVADRYQAAFDRRDARELAGFHTPDGIVVSPMFSTLRGRKMIEDAQRAFFTSFPDATSKVDAILIDPPQVALFATMNATHVNEFFGLPGTNRHIEFRLSRLLLMEGDQIAHERRIYDFTGLLIQVGVLKAKPAKG